MRNTTALPFWRAIRRSISEISKLVKLKPQRTGITSEEGKAFSLHCEVETRTTNDVT